MMFRNKKLEQHKVKIDITKWKLKVEIWIIILELRAEVGKCLEEKEGLSANIRVGSVGLDFGMVNQEVSQVVGQVVGPELEVGEVLGLSKEKWGEGLEKWKFVIVGGEFLGIF